MHLSEKEVEMSWSPGLDQEVEEKIRNRSAKLGVIGLGYVGLPLAMEMAGVGFSVTGIDLDRSKVAGVNAGMSHILDVPSETLFPLVSKNRIKATQSFAAIEALDTISICVPTPLRKTKDPDVSFIVAAAEAVANHLRPGHLIILESTTYPGTTRELVLPILEEGGLKVGKDFFLAYSPERVDPGNPTYNTRNIPKVLGGITPQCTRLATLLYQQFIERIVPVSSPESAETVKLVENTFRCVNIALANEMALLCNKLGIDVWEVIEAAKTKPFGFMAFYPGPGLGGHCIPVDPHYLSWKARMNGFEPRLIDSATQINSQMPSFVIGRVMDALNERQKSLKGSRILGLGVAYKRDTTDLRESPAIEVLRGLHERSAEICFSDPYVNELEIGGRKLKSMELSRDVLQSVDCVVILTDHSTIDYGLVATHSPLIVDTRNALKGFSMPTVVSL